MPGADDCLLTGWIAGRLPRQDTSPPHLLIRPFLQREAVLSSRIEGTQLDGVEIYNLTSLVCEQPRLKD